MDRRREGRLWSLLRGVPFVLGFVLLLTQVKSLANLYDEGLVLANAERIRAGAVPYRDFWTIYGPGYFYALAGLFSLVEPSVLVARVFDTMLRFLLTVEVYALARVLTSRRIAWIPYALVTFWLAAIRFYSYPAFPATGALLLAALLLARYLQRGGIRWLFLSGVALGLTALLRLDFGGYGALGFGVAVALVALRRRGAADSGRAARFAAILRAEGVLAAGALLVALPPYAYLALVSGLATVYDALIVFPLTVFPTVRHLPVPPLFPEFGRLSAAQWYDWLRLYLPLAIYVTTIVVSSRWLFLRPPSSSRHRPATAGLFLALTGTGLGLVVKATSRYHDLHVLPTTICAVILATALLYRIPRRLWRELSFRISFAGLALLFLTGPYVMHFWMLAARDYVPPTGCYSQLERAACVLIVEDQEQVAEYLLAVTRPDEFVFVGNSRHDLIFVNDLLLYFLMDRPIPTRYAELHPGLATTLPVQQSIVNDLEERDVRWIVTMQTWPSGEPNASSISSGVTFLDDYIRQAYQPDATFGAYQVWRR
ncbi:MAG: hypothetical protein ACP5HG_14615 [Anaerolineae bacterium]